MNEWSDNYNKMAKKYIIQIGEEQPYPFDLPSQAYQTMVVQVRPSASQNQQLAQVSQQLQRLMGMNCASLIHMVKVHEIRGKHFIIDYEYVQESLKQSQRLCQSTFLTNFKEKLYKFTHTIAEHRIKANITLQCIGLTKEGEPKVFLGLNFEIVPQNLKESLVGEYKTMIDRLLEVHFGFRNSLKAQSQVSHSSNKKLIEMEGKLNKLKLKGGHSSEESSGESCPAKAKEKKQKHAKNNSQVGGTSFSLIANHLIKPRAHKLSYQDGRNASKREEDMDDSLKKRFTNAYEKTQQAINLYEKYTKQAKKH